MRRRVRLALKIVALGPATLPAPAPEAPPTTIPVPRRRPDRDPVPIPKEPSLPNPFEPAYPGILPIPKPKNRLVELLRAWDEET